MHGLAFETSILYWQDQPDIISHVNSNFPQPRPLRIRVPYFTQVILRSEHKIYTRTTIFTSDFLYENRQYLLSKFNN
jgi:hypothetical protein